jgi:nitroimidazol reductase NimA-like FMN-containing flavoprotein (pyridoxamine 5'-phosphate oxidase superfamily)
VYYGHAIYSFATIGKKVDWMRANPVVYVKVEIVSRKERQTS